MKPIVIIAIAVVCSVVAVLGVLTILSFSAQIQYEEKVEKLQLYYDDLDLAESYKIQYIDIMSESCSGPLPTSFSEIQEEVKELKQKITILSLKQDTLQKLQNNMNQLQAKYPNSDYFELDYTCPYQEEWDEFMAKITDSPAYYKSSLKCPEGSVLVEYNINTSFNHFADVNSDGFYCKYKNSIGDIKYIDTLN